MKRFHSFIINSNISYARREECLNNLYTFLQKSMLSDFVRVCVMWVCVCGCVCVCGGGGGGGRGGALYLYIHKFKLFCDPIIQPNNELAGSSTQMSAK